MVRPTIRVSAPPLRRSRTALVALFAALVTTAALVAAPADADPAATDAPREGENRERLVVLLEGEPVATAVGEVHGAEAETHRAELAAQRADYIAWMRRHAPQAEVIWEYGTVLHGLSVRLRGHGASTLAGGPHVRKVQHPIWMRPLMNVSLDLVNWHEATGADHTEPGVDVGQDVFVGVIDTGIPAYDDDRTHPFFVVDRDNREFYEERVRGRWLCKHPPEEFEDNETEFTNCKVPVARVYKSDDPDATAEALHPHGSHVAGTIAGNSGTVDEHNVAADGGDLVLSGLAPAAFLGNYNVFPGEVPEGASSDDIAMAVEDAVLDGMDVLNLSLGGAPPRTGWTATEIALLNAAEVGVVSAVAAGNSGPGDETILAPGRAPWVITAGASTNPHFLGQLAEHGPVGHAGAAVGDFDAFPADGMTRDFVWWGEIDDGSGLACEERPLRDVHLDGQFALIQRGECTFTTKVRNAEDAGADGVVIFNNVAGDPIAMAHDGTEPFPEIPAVMVELDYGEALVGHSGTELTVGGEVAERLSDNADIIAGFSSRGPVEVPEMEGHESGYIIKPDLAAPGVNIHSSTLGDRFAMFQGTSMASPHLAGAAAALLWDRDWTQRDGADVREAKSLITNYAERVVLDHIGAEDLVGVNVQGVGRLGVAATFDGGLWADPVSASFGVVTGRRNLTATSSFTVSDDAIGTDDVRIDGPDLDGVTITLEVDDGTVTLTAERETRRVTGDYEGLITVSADDGEIVVPYWGRFE